MSTTLAQRDSMRDSGNLGGRGRRKEGGELDNPDVVRSAMVQRGARHVADTVSLHLVDYVPDVTGSPDMASVAAPVTRAALGGLVQQPELN